jgi:cysteine desulfurase/selenocysteine lyase
MTPVAGSFPLPGFGDFAGHIWLNTAHQGALPLAAAEAARDAIAWKIMPFELTQMRFDSVPMRLRTALGQLVNAPAEEIILANSASYGLQLIASAYPWSEGDEVLVMHGDFPSDILPWLLLERLHGIKVVQIHPHGRVVEPDELRAVVTPRTRLFCTTWVHSFSGFAVDFDALGAICREHGIRFVLNGSQALGARPLDLSAAPIDAFISVGFKWLCGPYGTGFAWIRPEFRQQLRPIKAYWLAMQTVEDLGNEVMEAQLREGLGARAYDVFGTANFFNFVPFAIAVEQLTHLGLGRVHDHDQALVSRFLEGIDRKFYTITSPNDPGPRRSTLVFFSHKDKAKNRAIYEALARARIHVAFRGGSMRLAPHLYNALDDIDRTLSALHDFA